MAPGSNTAAAIVLLSDGQSNVGPDPLKAAELAAKYGVRVYTVGMGTDRGRLRQAPTAGRCACGSTRKS